MRQLMMDTTVSVMPIMEVEVRRMMNWIGSDFGRLEDRFRHLFENFVCRQFNVNGTVNL